MIRLGLIGKNIEHSKSPEVYRALLKTPFSYDLLDYENSTDIPAIESLFPKYFGINITSPYKKHFFKSVILTENAKELGAINCLKFSEGKVYGENTDYLAILEIVKNWIDRFGSLEVVVLGDGVMSAVVQHALKKLRQDYKVASRKKSDHFDQLDLVKIFSNSSAKKVVINTCAREFVFKGTINSRTIFWDFNYDFSPHFPLKPQCEYIDGFEMLKLQAEYAVSFWSII